jgi:hypothetical protein
MGEKTVAQKLGLKAGRKLVIKQQPEEVAALIGALPLGAELVTDGTKPNALILMFARDKAALVKGLPACKRQLEPRRRALGRLHQGYVRQKDRHQSGQHSRVCRYPGAGHRVTDRSRRRLVRIAIEGRLETSTA